MRPLTSALISLSLLAVGSGGLAAQQPTPPIKEERAGLLRLAKIPADTARAIALRAVPHATIKSAEIENEDGRLAYSFDLVVAGKRGIEEVLVDAKTGKVVSTEHENEAAESAEQQRDSASRP